MKKKLIFLPVIYILVLFSANAQAVDSFKVYSKYDFVPGEKIIFYDDFSQENIGDFPAKWNTNGSGEIISTSGFAGKWFQMKGEGYCFPETAGNFPENFTAEFDLITKNKEDVEGELFAFGFYIVSGNMKNPNEGGAIPGVAGNKLDIGSNGCYYSSYSDGEYKIDGHNDFVLEKNRKYRLSFWVQKQRLRLYVDETKVFDVPRGMPDGFAYNILRFELGNESTPLITNFRVAAGLPDMRNKLLTEGKIVSYGIYFDVNSDKLKPESNGTLKEIGQVLKDNPAVRIKIVGHTDGDGDDALNLGLSKRRAVAVKAELVSTFGIDAARIETDGKGETQPVAPNDNALNKAKNRRVEFIKL